MIAALQNINKKTVLIVALSTIALISVSGFAIYQFLKPQPAPTPAPIAAPEPPPPPPPPATKASPLTGIEVAPDLADRPIVSVIIENHPDARPQSGLSNAGVVYEAVAEGGITRFLAIYLESLPPVIGPVRSLRPYLLSWALEFNSPVAHAGGSSEALQMAATAKAKNMNALVIGSPSFYRTTDRYAPHNLYTAKDRLENLLKSLGYFTPSQFEPTPRQKENPAPQPNATKINITYSYAGYAVEYQYNPAKNSYMRFLAGRPHIDRNTGAQIEVKNVVVQMMPTTYRSTGHAVMGTPGDGAALVFRDGTAVKGRWTKPEHHRRTKFYDTSENEILLNPGNTWYSIVPIGKTVTY